MSTSSMLRGEAPGGTPRRLGWTLVLLAFAQLIYSLDLNIVFVALPEIGSGLGFRVQTQQLVVSAYVVFAGGCLLLGGRAADLLGRRRMFVLALALYAVSSLAGGMAGSPGVIITARAIQGIGGALLLPSTLSLINTLFEEGPKRNRALAVWGGAGASGLTIGALLGGVLTEQFGWPTVFYVNVPLAGLVALAALFVIPSDRLAVNAASSTSPARSASPPTPPCWSSPSSRAPSWAGTTRSWSGPSCSPSSRWRRTAGRARRWRWGWTDPSAWAAPPACARPQSDVGQADALAARAIGPGRAQDPHVLAEGGTAGLEVRVEQGVLDRAVAAGQPQNEAAAGEDVDGGCRFRDEQRLPQRQHNGGGPEHDPLGDGREMPQMRERLEDGAGVAELLGIVQGNIPDPQAGEAQGVGEARQFGVAGQVRDAERTAGGPVGTQARVAPVIVERELKAQSRQTRGVHEPLQDDRCGRHRRHLSTPAQGTAGGVRRRVKQARTAEPGAERRRGACGPVLPPARA
ncbi:hypothetical protein GCM10010246_79650 [Streptomyces cuspidosporus]|uniref:Major facilitator superfamily (MFS) profile domain-containing protein n=1 Tax=Streptomyces cuspidosporus TaxID=66882 RepID=A0ABN3H9E9_9ACTN